MEAVTQNLFKFGLIDRSSISFF